MQNVVDDVSLRLTAAGLTRTNEHCIFSIISIVHNPADAATPNKPFLLLITGCKDRPAPFTGRMS